MRKKIKMSFIVLGILILVILIFFTIDYRRVQRNQRPLFCINVATYRDGGTKIYYGLGYKVIAFHKMLFLNESSNEMEYYQDIKIGTWYMDYNDFTEEIMEKENANQDKEYHKSKLNSIPRELTPKEASERGYFVYDGTKDELYNKETLDRFVRNTEMDAINRIADEIILVIYNINGDPTIYSLVYQDKGKTGYVLATDATRVDTSKTERIEIPKEYNEVVINTDIPSEHYGITITEDFGISAGIITLTSYSKKDKDIEIARYLLNSEVVSTKINPNEVTTIDIEKFFTMEGEEQKTITLNQEEIYDMIEIINGLNFKKETCDGIPEYYIKVNNKEKDKEKNYGIEVYSNEYHITLTQKGEAIVSEEKSQKLNRILEKYFK